MLRLGLGERRGVTEMVSFLCSYDSIVGSGNAID